MHCTQVLPLCKRLLFGLANMDFNSNNPYDASALISIHGHEATEAADSRSNICALCTHCGTLIPLWKYFTLLLCYMITSIVNVQCHNKRKYKNTSLFLAQEKQQATSPILHDWKHSAPLFNYSKDQITSCTFTCSESVQDAGRTASLMLQVV